MSTPRERVLEGLWEFAQPVHMCFVDLEKAYRWCILSSMGQGVSNSGSDDVVLMASSGQDQHALQCRTFAVSELVWMRNLQIEAMVRKRVGRKRVACPLQVGGEVLPQVEEFKYPGVLFTSLVLFRERSSVRLIDRRIGAAQHASMSVYRTVVVKKELESKGRSSQTGQFSPWS
ncbi:hypothetical protein L3Q82_002435 [Scortum barcoo]|uniref:Uncharacterized protein n=1 Tax=Scortum barcoo TaxID=214431 RepID=A0ACB8VYA3_9TELE|nr:hypothetical protein L3Q82_002435 [Scortum barcoo]